MKFNLKNRPKLGPSKSIAGWTPQEEMFEDWFKGLEKELRELLGKTSDMAIDDAKKEWIRELLGEV
jgi:hypothetical protein